MDERASPIIELPEGLPNSARQVFETLAMHGALTHKDLVRVTGMPGRTVRYAVGRLREAGVLAERCNLQDCRQCFFYLADACAGKPGYQRPNVVFAGIREMPLS